MSIERTLVRSNCASGPEQQRVYARNANAAGATVNVDDLQAFGVPGIVGCTNTLSPQQFGSGDSTRCPVLSSPSKQSRRIRRHPAPYTMMAVEVALKRGIPLRKNQLTRRTLDRLNTENRLKGLFGARA